MKRPVVLLIALSAAGCVQSTDKYPSLALRPIETRSDEEVVTPMPVATPDAALDAQIAAMAARLAQIDRDFVAGATRADTAARAKGALTTGSDQWLAAQVSLADIDGLRGDTLGMINDLERMVTDRGVAGQPPYPALNTLHLGAQDQLRGEIAKIAAIKALLGLQ